MSVDLNRVGTGNADYDGLPASIRDTMTLKEWLWLDDAGKAALVDRMTTPEWDE